MDTNNQYQNLERSCIYSSPISKPIVIPTSSDPSHLSNNKIHKDPNRDF